MLALIGAFERSFAMPIALTHLPWAVCTPTIAPGAEASRNPRLTAALSRARCRGGSGALDFADVPVASAFVPSATASSPQAPTSAATSRTCTTTALVHRIRASYARAWRLCSRETRRRPRWDGLGEVPDFGGRAPGAAREGGGDV